MYCLLVTLYVLRARTYLEECLNGAWFNAKVKVTHASVYSTRRDVVGRVFRSRSESFGDYAGSAGDEIQWGKYDVIVSIVVVTDVL